MRGCHEWVPLINNDGHGTMIGHEGHGCNEEAMILHEGATHDAALGVLDEFML